MEFPVDLPPDFLARATSLGVRAEDIEEHFIRGSGHGGQKINKTASCVQLVHRPTGIEVRCQKHREQSKNRLSAYKLLILKIEERVRGTESKRQQEIFKIRKQKQRRSRKGKEKMLREKHRHSDIKQARGPVSE
jgi:protein subunit release factor B